MRGRGGDVHNLLVLARLRACRDRRDERARHCARNFSHTRARCCSTPKRSTRTADDTLGTSPGVHPPRAHQRRDAHHQRRSGLDRNARPAASAIRTRARPSGGRSLDERAPGAAPGAIREQRRAWGRTGYSRARSTGSCRATLSASTRRAPRGSARARCDPATPVGRPPPPSPRRAVSGQLRRRSTPAAVHAPGFVTPLLSTAATTGNTHAGAEIPVGIRRCEMLREDLSEPQNGESRPCYVEHGQGKPSIEAETGQRHDDLGAIGQKRGGGHDERDEELPGRQPAASCDVLRSGYITFQRSITETSRPSMTASKPSRRALPQP